MFIIAAENSMTVSNMIDVICAYRKYFRLRLLNMKYAQLSPLFTHRHGITMIYDRWNHSKAPPKKPPLLPYNIHEIRPDTNFLTSSTKSVPSKIKTQRSGITCMQLTSPEMPLSKTIHDQLRPLPRSSFKMSTKHLTLCLLSFYGSLTEIWSYAYILSLNCNKYHKLSLIKR